MRKLLFWIIATFVFIIAILPQPPDWPEEPSDKVQHMAAFVTLGGLAAWAHARTSPLKLLLFLSLFGAVIEIVQAVPMLHRDSDARDWAADTLACGAVLLFVRWRRARSGTARRLPRRD